MIRLSARAKAVFERVGWFEGRRVDVSAQVAALEAEGWVTNPFALEFLKTFDGLGKISQSNAKINTDSLEFTPSDGIEQLPLYSDWLETSNLSFFPIGLQNAWSIFIDKEGLIYQDFYGDIHRLGDDFTSCLDKLLFGGQVSSKIGSLP